MKIIIFLLLLVLIISEKLNLRKTFESEMEENSHRVARKNKHKHNHPSTRNDDKAHETPKRRCPRTHVATHVKKNGDDSC